LIDALSFIGHYPFRKLRMEDLNRVINKYVELNFKAIALVRLESLFYRNTNVANKMLLDDLKSVSSEELKIYPLAALNSDTL